MEKYVLSYFDLFIGANLYKLNYSEQEILKINEKRWKNSSRTFVNILERYLRFLELHNKNYLLYFSELPQYMFSQNIWICPISNLTFIFLSFIQKITKCCSIFCEISLFTKFFYTQINHSYHFAIILSKSFLNEYLK